MIKFTKMEGLGNDYIYIDCTKNNNIGDISHLAKIMSNRHFGIGGDGVILICKSKKADFAMRIFNSDGTEAEMCGNGIRCVGKFVYEKGLTKKQTITVETLAGIKILDLIVKNKKVETVRVDMGEPILQPNKIPIISPNSPSIKLNIDIEDEQFTLTCVSIGNPHAVTEVENIEEFNIEKYGSILEKDTHFPKRTNIEFIKIIDKKTIYMRVWERGTGETLACGTGACAALVACVLNNKTESKITVRLLGGDLSIEWNKQNNHVFMAGPARIVFEGEINND